LNAVAVDQIEQTTSKAIDLDTLNAFHGRNNVSNAARADKENIENGTAVDYVAALKRVRDTGAVVVPVIKSLPVVPLTT
jgi:hypothetical protein